MQRNSVAESSSASIDFKDGNVPHRNTSPATNGFFSSFADRFRTSHRYSGLNNDENDEIDAPFEQLLLRQLSKQKLSTWRWRCIASLLVVTIAVLGATSILPTFLASHDSTWTAAQHLPMSCGNSTEEATSRECQYHSLSNRWLPRRCDVSLAKQAVMEAVNHEEFQFWHDPTGESEITDEDWKDIEIGKVVWTTERHHFAHCVYLLAQSAATLEFGVMVEENAKSWNHTKHCIQTILSAGRGLPGWNKINSFVHIGSGSCG
jgi:hypothetical protein